MKVVLPLLLIFLIPVLFFVMPSSASSTSSLSIGNAIGISDVGVLNTQSGNISYVFYAPTIAGLVNFYGGDFYTFNGTSYSPEASFQLDGVMQEGSQYYWIQNKPVVENLGNNVFSIQLSDMIWNVTSAHSFMSNQVVGQGTVSYTHGTTVYQYTESRSFLTHVPFTLELFTALSDDGGNAYVIFYYELINSTNIAIGEFDNVTLYGMTQAPLFIAGGTNPSGLNGFEMVASASNDFSTLTVNSWNASMWLGYKYNNEYYTVPSALSNSFGITGNVSSVKGISEVWNNSGNVVEQTAGELSHGFLWNVSVGVRYSNGHVITTVTPGDSQWSVEIKNAQTGATVFSSPVNGSYESFSETLPQGYFIATFQLDAGSSVIYSAQSSFSTVDDASVTVRSVVPYFYENGLSEPSNSTIYVSLPSTISFPTSYPISNGERLFLLYSTVNGNREGDVVNITTPGVYTISTTYVLQYEVGFPFNVSLTSNGEMENFKNGWVDANSSIVVPSQIDYIAPGTRAIVSPINFTAYTPINVSLHYEEQYLVKFPFNLTFYVGNSSYFLNSTWVDRGSSLIIPSQIHYVTEEERYAVDSSKFEVTSPINFTPVYAIQYLVKFPFNLSVSVNGTVMKFSNAWINGSSVVVSSPQQVYIKPGVMYNVSPFSFQVKGPLNYTPSYKVYYYLSVTSSVPAQLNGVNSTVTSGYYMNGTELKVFKVYYVNSGERLVINSNVSSLTLTSPVYVKVTYTKQYYLSLPFNMTFYLNGEKYTGTTLWVNASTSVKVPQQYIYISNVERYNVTGKSFVMNESESVKLPYVVEYLVKVNGNSTWYPAGSTLTLNAPQGFFQTVTWNGTYHEPNGATLKVDQPITENSVTSLNYVNVGIVVAIVVLAIALLVAVFIKRKPKAQ
ncbi:thermopsin family protease [Sulfuracidifex tepidarius]|uniref:Thermopsin n=1 Tax=Sulfuracidifex tepidarius TaxID=1294262 RepID=A0A510E6D0_9CREN|nr:thermopsin family protease [Sulfuracidifex tepidarius]BBG27588.1 hypothetical protein IC007_2142 [Sulfuracidifex tepidarius]